MKRFFAACVLAVISAMFAVAQTPTGRLTGTVSSPDGVLPGATVVVTFVQTGKSKTITSGNDGSFDVPQLEPGLYRVNVTSQGFKAFVANEVKIDVGRDYNLPITLEVGSVQETVEVTAGADVITSTSAQVTSTVSPQQILSLPLITRDPLNLTTLQAGTASNAFQGTSINGMRTTLTNITRDGISINDQFIRANATDFAPGRPSVDDTGEFSISTSNQEADLGSGGAQITLVTPRGTKNFHGALFAYNRNSEFAANNFFNNRTGVARPFRNRNQYGGKISGPFLLPGIGDGGGPRWYKDKGYFFFAYEGIKDPLSQRYTRPIFTPEARGGTFRFTRATAGNPINSGGISCPAGTVGSVCTVSNILTFAQAQGFQGIPNSIDPIIQSQVLDPMPTVGNTAGIGDGLNTTGYALNRRFDTTRKTYTTRIDVDVTEKDSVNVVFSWNKENVLRPDVDTVGFDPNPDVTQFSKNKTGVATYRRIVTDNIVNEARWGIFTSQVPFDRISDYPAFFLGGQGTTSSTTGLAGLVPQPNIFLDQGRNNKLYSAADNVNWIVGKHSLKFGGQFQLYKVNSYNDVLIVPNYIIGVTNVNPATSTTLTTGNFPNQGGAGSIIDSSQLATANSFLAIMGGLVSQRIQGFNTTSPTSGYEVARNLSPFRNSNHSLYVSDRWSIASNLTLSLGVRWEIYPAMRLNNGLSLEPVIADLDNPAASLLAGNGSYDVLGTNSGEQYTYYKTDYDNFAPSIGVAWTPSYDSGIGKLLFGSSGRSVFRGGYSQVYGNDSIITSLNSTLAANVGLGRASSSAIGPNGTTALNDRLSGNNTPINPPAFVAPPRSFLQNNTAAQGFFGVANVVDPRLQIPKTEQYSFGFQREFWGNTAFEVRYVGTRSENLARGIDLNQIDIVGNGFLADFQRAQANLALSIAANGGNVNASTPFCSGVTPGCVPLTIFQNGGVGSTGHLAVGTGVTLTTFRSNLQNGTVADLAQLFISNNLNNHPTLAAPTRTPFLNFYQNPNIGQIELFTNAGFFNYNSIQMEVRRRFTDGLYFQANYTFSKNLTDTVGTSQNLFEPYLQNGDKDLDVQRADFDQTHVFNFNGIYQLPFGSGKRFLNWSGVADKLFGGWELSGLWQWSSGAPITFVDSRGTLNRGARSGRQTAFSSLSNEEIRALAGVFEANGNIYFVNPSIINSNGRASTGYIYSGLNANTTFNGQVFFNVDPGQTGNVTRTLINGPRNFNVNMALLKNVRFTESMRVQLRMEAFNVFNTVNFFNNTQLANINSATFGQITSAGAARQLQFAARFEF